MQISNNYTMINNPLAFNHNRNRNNQPKPNFMAHFDFYKLMAEGYNVTASCYFRRGANFGGPHQDFQYIISCLQKVFGPTTKTPKKMFIIGIGNSQEPFSMLASVRDIIKETPLKKKIDLYTVDLQSCPLPEKLYQQSFLDDVGPAFAKNSFIVDKEKNKYRVKDDIFKYLEETYYNPQKSKWDTRIQDVIEEYPDESFDIVSSNNTLFYIRENDLKDYTLTNIGRILRPGGYFITDPDINIYNDYINSNTRKIHGGIYKKF